LGGGGRYSAGRTSEGPSSKEVCCTNVPILHVYRNQSLDSVQC
jgi:hypothetical protein